jgi:3-mercaptopyruvate sulfurtransferase SseA
MDARRRLPRLDTRTRAEFTGEDARNRARSGHLPGARHLSHVDLLENGVIRPAPALRIMLERVGFGPGGPYCDPLRRRRKSRARRRGGGARRI